MPRAPRRRRWTPARPTSPRCTRRCASGTDSRCRSSACAWRSTARSHAGTMRCARARKSPSFRRCPEDESARAAVDCVPGVPRAACRRRFARGGRPWGAAVMSRFRIADRPFDIAPLRQRLLHGRAGAFAAFEGWVRDHNEGRPVHGLRYEAYVELAEAEGERIVEEALARFDILEACCVHRVGDLAI